MSVIKLKLSEILQVEGELNGLSQKNNQTGEAIQISKGFLSEKLPLSTKYWLMEFNKQIAEIKKSVDSLYEEMIKKYGVEDKETGSISIPMYIEKTVKRDDSGNIISGDVNPSFTSFQEEYNQLLNEVKEFEFTMIPLSVTEKIETEEVYPLILQKMVA